MTIQLEFLGAAGGVTGSRTLLKADGFLGLVDCGLFQGPKAVRQLNWEPERTPSRQVQAVILTHAHLDHSGFLPRFFAEGWRGPVYCSEGTAELLPVMLRDAAYLESEFSGYANKTGYSSHKPAKPLFTMDDVEAVLPFIKPVPRYEWLTLSKHISFRFGNAGHIIGASFVQFAVNQGQKNQIITFSGDLGHSRSLTIRPPDPITETDILIIESTYGARTHPRCDIVKEFSDIAKRTFNRNGVLVIPAFAVGRAQEILYIIRCAEDQGLIPRLPVVLDSPMANVATDVFLKHQEDHRESSLFANSHGKSRYLPQGFTTTTSSDESMLTCMKDGPMTVISAAGMLNGGRILHHLKSRLPYPENTVLFCGYQAEGTKGRVLQERAEGLTSLRIHHQDVPIEAEIATIASLSAHGDWIDLSEWLKGMSKAPKKIFINHGDPESVEHLNQVIHNLFPQTKIEGLKAPGVFSDLV